MNVEKTGVIFDGTFDGLLCIIYAHYYNKINPDYIMEGELYQQTLQTNFVKIETDYNQSHLVFNAIQSKISQEALDHIYAACLHESTDKFIHIYKYILLGFKVGKKVYNYMQNDYVLHVHKMSKFVYNEAHLLKGFCRFSETKQNILYARISPNNNTLSLVANHFADRLMNEQWIIHDTKRNIAAIYDGNEFIISAVPSSVVIEFSDNEQEYQELWCNFFKSIAIENRKNSKLQRNLLPKRYRSNMVEFQTGFTPR